MTPERIDELVRKMRVTILTGARADDVMDAFRTALTTLAREVYEDAALLCDGLIVGDDGRPHLPATKNVDWAAGYLAKHIRARKEKFK